MYVLSERVHRLYAWLSFSRRFTRYICPPIPQEAGEVFCGHQIETYRRERFLTMRGVLARQLDFGSGYSGIYKSQVTKRRSSAGGS